MLIILSKHLWRKKGGEIWSVRWDCYSDIPLSLCSLWLLFYDFQNHPALFHPAREVMSDSFSLKRIYSALDHQRQSINQRLAGDKVS